MAEYFTFGNFGENFIFANSAKRLIFHAKNSRIGHNLPVSVNGTVLSSFCEAFLKFRENKPSRKFPNLQ